MQGRWHEFPAGARPPECIPHCPASSLAATVAAANPLLQASPKKEKEKIREKKRKR